MNTIKKIFLLLIILSLPVLLIASSIRFVLTPLYVNLEYRMPGFPEDPYGFTTYDRLEWSQYTLDYLLGRIPHSDLVAQKLPDKSSLYNERETSHLYDVMLLSQLVIRIWFAILAFFLLTLLISFLMHWIPQWLISVKQGAFFTIALIGAILIYVWVDFNQLFTQFHQVFFEGDTWLFYPSDNLIRLFPLRFWMDLFIFIGGLTLTMAVLLIILTRRVTMKIK